jgi:hypothetical protein
MESDHSWSDVFDSIAPMAWGLGLITLVLFPFALPLLFLTIAATLPLLLPVALFGALVAMLWGVRLGMRAAGRGVRRLRSLRERHVPGASIGQLR